MANYTLTDLKRTERQGPKGPYVQVSIKTYETGDKFVSGYGGPQNENWRIGDVVEIDIVPSKNTDKYGNPYLNFYHPKNGYAKASPSKAMPTIKDQDFEDLKKRVTALEKIVAKLDIEVFPPSPAAFEDEVINRPAGDVASYFDE